MTLDRAVTWFIGLWIGLVILLNIVAVLGFVMSAPTVWAGIAKIQDTYSPLNLWNWIAEVVSLLPALGALAWRNRRRSRGATQRRD